MDGIIYRGDFTASVLVTQVDGIAVSVDYVLNGEDAQDDGIFGAAADINIGELLGTETSQPVFPLQTDTISRKAMISQSRYTAALISSKSLLNTHTQRMKLTHCMQVSA